MKKKNKQIPVFQNEDHEREFWAKNSPLDYMKTSSVSLGNFPKFRNPDSYKMKKTIFNPCALVNKGFTSFT